MLRGTVMALFAFAVFFLVVGGLLPRFGIGWTYAIAAALGSPLTDFLCVESIEISRWINAGRGRKVPMNSAPHYFMLASRMKMKIGGWQPRIQTRANFNSPSFSITVVILSPALSHTCFSVGLPLITPSGVPVKNMSPGFKVKCCDA